MGRVGGAYTRGLGTGQLLQPRAGGYSSGAAWVQLLLASPPSCGFPKSEIATWPRSSHLP